MFIGHIKNGFGVPEWLSLVSVRPLILAQVMISQFVGSSPVLGSELVVQRLLRTLSLSAPPPCMHACTLSQNK